METSLVGRLNGVVTRATSTPLLALIRNLVFLHVAYRYGRFVLAILAVRGPLVATKDLVKFFLQSVTTFARTAVPGANILVKREIAKQIRGVQKSVIQETPGEKRYVALPQQGLAETDVRAELIRYQRMGHVDWKGGKVSGAIYHGGDDISALITEAFGLFTISNPLHPEVFPGIRKMEAEVVSMVLRMYNAPPSACGSVTSGGTESILMAIKAYRDRGLEEKGITEPEMVVPVTLHAAVDKAASYFKIKLVHIPVDASTGKVDVQKMARAINRNTIMVAGSAPNFPHGIIDDLPAIAALARKHNIGMHVDCCLGGFLVPFMEKAGYPLPHFCDFRLEGVTSISADTHKYGFAPKGSSVVMYRTKELRNYQYFVTTEWPGGLYASPSIAGSRPGALIAGCWAMMVHFGESGYVRSTQDIIGAARRISSGIETIPQLHLIGDPLLSVVAFAARAPMNTYAVADLLTRKGWHLNVLQNPPAIHIAC
ncbi:pyridoxal phosphate-dependent transferase, partial [Blyttiomyces helicus]